jgi:hypothetical protein
MNSNVGPAVKSALRTAGAYVIAALVILAAFYIIRILFKEEIPPNNRDAVMMVVGAVMGWAGAVVNFYFGSSKGSEDKTEALAAAAKKDGP